jgi:hypothetical protein
VKDQVIPPDLISAGIQYSIDDIKANFEKNKKLSDLLDQIREKCIREVYESIGSKSNEYMMFRQKAREIARTMRPLFTATPEGRRVERQFHKMRLAEANEFIKGLGINLNDVKSILRKYREESRSVIEKTRNSVKLLDTDVVAPPPSLLDPDSPWSYIYPPYWYSYGDRWEGHTGDAIFGSPYIVHFENHMTGEISCRSQLVIYNAGDYAADSSAATSAVLINFQMPASGRIDAWSYLQCVGSSYDGTLIDEFGWSGGDVAQTSRYFMVTGSPPDYDYANFSLLNYHRKDDEGDWCGIMAQPGEYRYCHFISDISYPAGEWIRMATGINDIQDTVVNDMSSFAEITSSWIVRMLAISAYS